MLTASLEGGGEFTEGYAVWFGGVLRSHEKGMLQQLFQIHETKSFKKIGSRFRQEMSKSNIKNRLGK